ncbi:MAG: GIY-YIG nuclease family protein [Bacteroidia bacterium]|nr:GIY-YIG nuclease family protein [Bacteroidia bacterium]
MTNDKYTVYILKCSDDSYYTGITNDIDRRMFEHETGASRSSYTYSKRPLKLLFQEHFHDPNQAIKFEKQIKGWNRKKKEALIEGDWDEIVRFSNRKKNT